MTEHRGDRNAATDTLEGLLARIRSHESEFRSLGISHLELFGSRARGFHNALSDVDLMVEYEPNQRASYFHLARVKMLLEEDLGVRVDVLMKRVVSLRGRDPGTTIRVF